MNKELLKQALVIFISSVNIAYADDFMNNMAIIQMQQNQRSAEASQQIQNDIRFQQLQDQQNETRTQQQIEQDRINSIYIKDIEEDNK